MARPERYQLSFDFDHPPAELPTGSYPITAGGLAELDPREPGTGRFMRAVREEFIIRSPAEAARYLLDHVYAPFEACDETRANWGLSSQRQFLGRGRSHTGIPTTEDIPQIVVQCLCPYL
jgi:hypothetical protein